MAIDRDLLGLYLADHLTGATAGLGRVEHMCATYTDLPGHGELVQTRDELQREVDRLRQVIQQLGTRPRRLRQAAAWVGEKAGRLKLNRRLVSRSPMTPVLELELLRGAVMAKQGLWEVLRDYAPQLGLDAEEFAELTVRAGTQRDRLAQLHATLRASAFTEESPSHGGPATHSPTSGGQ